MRPRAKSKRPAGRLTGETGTDETYHEPRNETMNATETHVKTLADALAKSWGEPTEVLQNEKCSDANIKFAAGTSVQVGNGYVCVVVETRPNAFQFGRVIRDSKNIKLLVKRILESRKTISA